MRIVMWSAKAHRIEPVGRCKVKIIVYKDNRRSDEDNVRSGASKVILDALKHSGIIKDDSKKYVESSEVIIEYIKGEPYVVVEIEELEQ